MWCKERAHSQQNQASVHTPSLSSVTLAMVFTGPQFFPLQNGEVGQLYEACSLEISNRVVVRCEALVPERFFFFNIKISFFKKDIIYLFGCARS